MPWKEWAAQKRLPRQNWVRIKRVAMLDPAVPGLWTHSLPFSLCVHAWTHKGVNLIHIYISGNFWKWNRNRMRIELQNPFIFHLILLHLLFFFGNPSHTHTLEVHFCSLHFINSACPSQITTSELLLTFIELFLRARQCPKPHMSLNTHINFLT